MHLAATRAGNAREPEARLFRVRARGGRSGATRGARDRAERRRRRAAESGHPVTGAARPDRDRHARRRSAAGAGTAARRGAGERRGRVGPNSRRYGPAVPGQEAGPALDRVVPKEPGIPPSRDATRPPVPGLHRAGSREARAAHGVRAASRGGERVPRARVLSRGGVGPVAVHAVDRQAVRAEAELVVRRSPRHRRVHSRRARLPHQADAGVRE